MAIKELRILPPLAIARFGSASEPQHNYTLQSDKRDPLGFRKIVREETLKVATNGTVAIAADGTDLNEMFRDGVSIRPVAPFFELWAIMEGADDTLVRLSREAVEQHQLGPVQWRVRVENRKVFRRTGDKNDIVRATTPWFSGHGRKMLHGKCRHFIDGGSVDFGSAQSLRPAAGDGVSFRLRFTPARGKIYGPVAKPDGSDAPPRYVTPIYADGAWNHFDAGKPGNKKESDITETWPNETLPSSLYANKEGVPPWLNRNSATGLESATSLGYLDDACDGFIEARLKGDKRMRAKARICVGPPDFVLDSQFVRTLADDLDQVVKGPGAGDLDVTEARARALDIVRRAYETVRMMNVAVMNGNDVNGRRAEAFDTMPAEVAFGTERQVEPVMRPESVDTAAILALHQQVFAALSAGAVPWFPRLLRRPDEMGDLTDRGRRKMPALMSGADSFYLALTHRQIATIEKAAEAGIFEAGPSEKSGGKEKPGKEKPGKEAPLSPRNLTSQILYKAAGNPINSTPEMAVANCCPGLEFDFRAVWRRLFVGIELSEHDNYVVAGTAVGPNGRKVNLKGRRLLRIADSKDGRITPAARGKDVITELKGPSSDDPVRQVPVLSGNNPHGIWTMEWSNCFAHVIALRAAGITEVECEFTRGEAKNAVPLPRDAETEKFTLRVQDFFESGTAVISEELAQPGELTQGLCSPWQNDLRECSCYYWASSRPDFVNQSIGLDGLSHGDNWLAKVHTAPPTEVGSKPATYVPDDYADSRLIGYKDLFDDWEQLQLQIGGRDSAPDLPELRAAKRPLEP